MTEQTLSGVIAAIATAVDAHGAPDLERSVAFARYLLDNGCDGLNVLGTTGEATSFSLAERQAVMTAYAKAGLPMSRLMVGTGAAALSDSIALTQHAAALGFAGALLLPPFYYKGVSEDGLFAYVDAVIAATKKQPIPFYLYHFPALSGVPWTISLLRRLLDSFNERIVGLKDSSNDLPYAREAAALKRGFAVFPSNEAVLLQARELGFAGCISGSANCNAGLCARAWHDGDARSQAGAVAIRALFDGKPLIPGVKALLAHIHGDQAWAAVKPPLAALSAAEQAALAGAFEQLRIRPAA